MSEKMTRPALRWGGPKGTVRPPVSEGEAITRGVGALLVLTNPVAAALSVVASLVWTRTPLMRRVRGWWVALGAVLVAAATVRWTGSGYLSPWVELRETITARGLEADAIGRLGAERWSAWLVAQLPLAALLAAAAAGVVVTRRQRYSPDWRTDESVTRDLWAEKKAVRAKPEKPAKAGTALEKMSMRLGHSPAGDPVRLSASEVARHVVVTGPTGIGKTTTLLRLVHAFLVDWQAAKCPLVMFDFKADPAVRDALRVWADQTGRRFWFVSVTEPGVTYDALAGGSAEEVASRLVEMIAAAKDGGFSEPHHRSVGERWLIMTLLVLDDLRAGGHRRPDTGQRWARTLEDLAELMRVNVLTTERALAGEQARRRANRLLEEIAEVPDLAKSIAGMRTRVALMAETAAGRVLVAEAGGLALEAAIRGGDVVLFGLSAQSNAAAARVVGNLAIADLGAIFDRLQHESWATVTGRRGFLVLDEFTGLGGEALMTLYERARGGGGSIVSSTQMGDGFKAVSDEFDASVWGNSNVWLLHQQGENDAEPRAIAMGTERGWTETVQVHEDADPLGTTGGSTGVGSLRRADHFRVHPNELKQLGVGEVVMRVKSGNRIERVCVEEVPGACTSRLVMDAPPAAALEAVKSPVAQTATRSADAWPSGQPASGGREARSGPVEAASAAGWGWTDPDDDVHWPATDRV